MQKYVQSVSTETARYQSDLSSADSKFKNDIENFKAKSGEIRAENSENTARYAADAEIWTANSGNIMNEFNGQIAKLRQEYQWYANTLQSLRAQYESGFILSPEAQQQGAK